MKQANRNGALKCARYAFAPNLYHYCGPETGGEMGAYLEAKTADRRLVEYLTKFETLYPYLTAIARANSISDPLDEKVVEAYWVGNLCLEKVGEQEVYEALTLGQGLYKRLKPKEMKWLLPKIDKGARLHHSFHVLNVFTRTGHRMVAQTLETMDECRISWGRIITKKQIPRSKQISNSKFQIKSQKLIYSNAKLELVPATREVVVAQEELAKSLNIGDYVSVHWGIVCDQINIAAVKQLNFYTQQSLKLANETL